MQRPSVVVDFKVENYIYQYPEVGMSYIVGLNIIASENAARNILVAGGHAETKNGRSASVRYLPK